MDIRSRRIFGSIYIVLCGCSETPAQPRDDFQKLAISTFVAARNADTARVIAATSDTSTAVLILNIIAREPKLAEAFVRNSHPLRPLSITSDSAYIFYGFRYRFAREILAVSFKRHGLKWRITYVGFPERM